MNNVFDTNTFSEHSQTKNEDWLLMEPGDRSDVALHANKEVVNPTMTYIVRIRRKYSKKFKLKNT